MNEFSSSLELIMTVKLLFTITDMIEKKLAETEKKLAEKGGDIRKYYIFLTIGERALPDDRPDFHVFVLNPMAGYLTKSRNPISEKAILYMSYASYKENLYRDTEKMKELFAGNFPQALNRKISVVVLKHDDPHMGFVKAGQDVLHLEESADLAFWPFEETIE